MKYFLILIVMIFAVVAPAMSQFDVPPVTAPDDSLPVLGSVMLDPSDHPATFRVSGFFDIFTELSLDFSASGRFFPHVAKPTTASLTGTASLLRSTGGGSGLYKNLPLEAVVLFTPTGSSGETQTFETEMLQLSISGGGLPSGVMLRESPTLHSTGQTTIKRLTDGRSMVSSFFDVFTELSLDGGATWTPADDSIPLETKILPHKDVVQFLGCIPPGISVGDLNGDGYPDLVVTNRAPSPPSPPVGSSITQPFQCDAQVLYDGIQRAVSNNACVVRVTHTYDDGPAQFFDTEMLQLDISGGTLPGGVMIRESPSKASTGRTRILQLENVLRISSFFDIFTEISLDGGQTWTPRSPATLEYTDTIPSVSNPPQGCVSEATYPNDLYPFAGVLYSRPPRPHYSYSNGMKIQGLMLSSTSPHLPLPLLGEMQVYGEDEDCDGTVDDASGTGYTDFHATGSSSIRVLHSSDNGEERVFDTEMLQLNLVSNLSGQVLMVRESPSKASIGRTSIRPNGNGFMISSFFDIFTEISLDGGQTWFPSAESVRVEQMLYPPLKSFETTNFPPPGVFRVEPACSEVQFANGARLRSSSFFDIFADVALPPPGGSSTNTATGRSRQSLSLDGGNSFFDIFPDVSMSLRCDATNNTPTDHFFDTEILSMTAKDTTRKIRLRESPTEPSRGQTKLRESPTLPHRVSSFFDIFTEISLDDGQTWSPSLTPMRIELDSVTNGSISGVKWHDVNGNGIHDLAESGLSNWKIILADSLGNIVDTVRTNASGNYTFQNVPFGVYRISEELKDGWLQTGGSPVYGFPIAPGDSVIGIDFGNFRAPRLSGVVFNDLNGNGTFDPGEVEGKKLYVGNLPYSRSSANPGIKLHTAAGSFGISLNGLPPGEPVTGSLTGYSSVRKGWDGTIKGRYFENGDIPTEMLALELSSAGPVHVGGSTFNVVVQTKKEFKGHVTLLKLFNGKTRKFASAGPAWTSFFDISVECSLSPVSGSSTGGTNLHGDIVIEADLGSVAEPEPLTPGTIYRGGPVTIYDDAGMPAGTLDSLAFVVGAPASAENPIFTPTDNAGAYSFSPLLPGTWVIFEQSQPCWVQTTLNPPPVVAISGVSIPSYDFGSYQQGGKICVTKYYDINHDQSWEPSTEPPMAGVTFTLIGANNTFTGITDGIGKVCFDNLPPDSYMLTEALPNGYTYSVPKDGQIGPFSITGCEEITDLIWLNTAGATADSFRTARYEDWALAVDMQNKPKAVKAKDDKVVLKFNIVSPLAGFTGFELDFGMLVTGQVTEGKDKLVPVGNPFTDQKKIAFTGLTIDSSDTFQVDAIGAKGKKAKVKVKWTGRTVRPLTIKQTVTEYKRNDPQLPMPNLHNVGQELFGVGQPSYFPGGLLIGTPIGDKKAKSVLHMKYADVLKSLVKYGPSAPILHNDSIRCLDIYPGGNLMKSQVKSLPPDKNSNKLFAELLALKLNVAASVQGKFPNGLGELTYLNKQDPSSPFNDQTVNEIIAKADSMISCLDINSKPVIPTVGDLYIVLRDINNAFYGDLDTVSFAVKTVLKGVKDLKSVPYLHATPGLMPAVSIPGARQIETPAVYKLDQNYPNPFNPTTTIQFEIPEASMVTLKVYNMLGQEIATLMSDAFVEAGTADIEFDANNLPSGVYFYRITAHGIGDQEEGIAGGTFTQVKKMILLK